MTELNQAWNGKEERQPSNAWKNSELSPTTPQSSLKASEISSWLATRLAQILEIDPQTIDVSQDLTDYGLSSIEAVNLSGELETFLDRRLPPTLLWDYSTIESLAEYLASELGKSQTSDPELQKLSESDKAAEIPPEYYCFDRLPEYRQLQEQLEEVKTLGIGNPFFIPQEGVATNLAQIGGRQLINYANYNYVGLCGDPKVSQAAKDAIERYGTSACASRLISGEKPIHRQLEQAIADFIGTEDSIVYVGGHGTNVSTISHLFGQNDLIVYDALSHNSIIQGCLFSGASIVSFPHNDWQALDRLLAERRHRYRRVLIAIEGVYSTDGDIPELPQFIEIKQRYKAFLLVDEAHSIGVLGKSGRGIGECFDVNPADVDLWMGTLSKTFASCGGYIAGSQALVEYLKYTSPGFVFSVGISPPNAAASLAALEVLKAEPERVTRLRDRARLFLDSANKEGLNTGMSGGSAVIPIIVGDSLRTIQLSQNLFHKGINVPFMIYPSVPHDRARLRFFLTCDHTEEQIHFTVDTLAAELAKI